MKNLILVLLGGLSGERKISLLTGKACSKSLKKLGYKVKELDPQGNFVEKIKKLWKIMKFLKMLILFLNIIFSKT